MNSHVYIVFVRKQRETENLSFLNQKKVFTYLATGPIKKSKYFLTLNCVGFLGVGFEVGGGGV